jgi:hypothetical protein
MAYWRTVGARSTVPGLVPIGPRHPRLGDFRSKAPPLPWLCLTYDFHDEGNVRVEDGRGMAGDQSL